MSARIAVIGCGWWSTYAHLPALAKRPDAEVVALADTDPARLAAAAGAFGVPAAFPGAAELLDAVEVDAMVVAVPHAAHHPVARLALERGVHVLLEKPMTIEPAHAHELVALARSRGAELLIDYPWHYNPHVLALREQIAAGRIGPVEHVSVLYASTVRELYRGDPEPYRDAFGYPVNAPDARTYSDPDLSGGGQGQTQITHAAALLLWLTGLRPRGVAAFRADFELPVDLADGIAVRFEGGAVGTLGSTGAVLAGLEEIMRLEVFGRDGHILLDVNQGTASVHDAGGVTELPPLPAAERNPEHAPVQNLVDLAQGRGVNGSPAEIGRDAVRFVAAMYRSAREGSIVDPHTL
ncbi:Gfo/Idh/MocA family oxidoreductase [Streptomyces sp. NBC_01808]|uniref:Gfo/Idh/MocA family protein n=1 Tax=Streptomyces sp. NBC_01808 TaxID=2975947 RepID=UPI002DD9D14B|nr:Gfo/Idh/MocA family oxidoreductase [Streptomyces sp. NBC_01808]WSA36276.1 Gfo/Idh/MocA family oxidoreductase [Streptomyces sp. NBC_01808]